MNTARRNPRWLGRIRRVHMVGIGGVGMSSIAAVLLDRGFEVSGSDLAKSDLTDGLEKRGATIFEGHAPDQIGSADAVVYSSAVIPQENAETLEAMARRVPLIPRAEMLGELMRMKFGVGIAGTHGKTTTTSLVGLVLTEGGFDPTIIVGGKVAVFGSNAVSGEGDIIVIEADEYDRTFLRLTPALAVITSIEAEHLDTYSDLDDLKSAFLTYANSVPFFGASIVCLDDGVVQEIMGSIQRRLVTYGTVRQAMVRAESIVQEGSSVRFMVVANNEVLGVVTLQAPGLFNVQNALAAIAVGLEMDIEFPQIQSGLSRFTGVNRRFQILGEAAGIVVIDDYAHHPTEVEATLLAACDAYPDRRIVAVFQPHLYSRTESFKERFGASFHNADVLVVTDIYGAREVPRPGVSGRTVADSASARGHRNVQYVAEKAKLAEELSAVCSSGDAVVFLGAGDIWRCARTFFGKLQRSAA